MELRPAGWFGWSLGMHAGLQPVFEDAGGPARDGGFGQHAVEGVRCVSEDVQVGRDAGGYEPAGVVDVLVQQAVEIADGDERGGQPGAAAQ